MTGNQVADRIAAHRRADGPRRAGAANRLANGLIANQSAWRNLQQRLPNFDLKIRSHHQEAESALAVQPGKNLSGNRRGRSRLFPASGSTPM